MAVTRAIIFSMNRAMQLDATLRSLYFHCADVESMEIYVLYRTTDTIYTRQYEELIERYPHVRFVVEKNFRQDLLFLVNPYSLGSNANRLFWFISKLGEINFHSGTFLFRFWRGVIENMMLSFARMFLPLPEREQFYLFLVDDGIFTNKFNLQGVLDTLRQRRDLLGFSFRLGENTTRCYVRNSLQELPSFINNGENILIFKWVCADQDFGYPLEISSSLYSMRVVLPLFVSISFRSPNALEEKMAYHARNFRVSHPYLSCYRRSVAFCNPVNIVQKEIANRVGGRRYYQVDELCDRFERGENINIDALNGFISNACHQEVELSFENRKCL